MKLTSRLLLIFLALKFAGCANVRPLQYVQGSFDTARLSRYVIKEPLIQIGDLMSITVFSDNPEATALYNPPNGATYLVDNEGNIQFYGIGKLQVAGLTKQQLTTLLNSKLTTYLRNPFYSIRFMNYKVTLLGEVNREGIYSVTNERVNIFDAIGLAGGLTIYARRENVMIIREANGKREFARLDLTDPQVFNSPYYFLQQNDLVVVDPARGKTTATEQVTLRNITIISSIISTLAIIYSLTFRR
jgi:polysaccharide biosynthesis/export protein